MRGKPASLLLAALLSLGAPLAAQASVTLEKIADLPTAGGVISPDSTLFAAYLGSSVAVWRLQDGHQVHKIPLASDETVGQYDLAYFTPLAMSPDDRFVLVSFTHVSGTYSSKDRVTYKLYLVSLEDETATLLPAAWKSYCHQKPLHYPGDIEPWIEPTLDADFSPDGRTILVQAMEYTALRAPENREGGATDVFVSEAAELDLKGKVLHKTSETFRWPLPRFLKEIPSNLSSKEGMALMARPPAVAEHPTGARVSGFREDGLLVGVVQDESGCELRDLHTQKRLGFLDGCDDKDQLYFDGHRSLVTGVGDFWVHARTLKRWDLETGRRLASLPCESCRAEFRGDHAFVTRDVFSAGRSFEIRDASLASVLLSSQPSSGGWIQASPDASLLIAPTEGGAGAVYRTGLSAGAAAPVAQAAEPLIDVDAVPAAAAKPDPDAYALVIGIERYRQDGIPAVDFAARDARSMYSYLTGAMGFDAKNVVLLTDAQATRTDFDKNLKWLSNRATAKSRVFVYYAGHGSPNPSTGQGYLMPYEADPAYLDETAFPLAKLYAALGKLPTKDVTVVLDACFSGQGQRSLIAMGTRPLVHMTESPAQANTAVLAAAAADQVSASFPAAQHGLLTYYLLAGLHGEADAKGDGRIDAAELYAYVRPAVERAAKLQNVEQTPTFTAAAGASRPWIVLPRKK